MWLENPGHQPVDDDVQVEYMMLTGKKESYAAGLLVWDKCGGASSIVSYRILHKPMQDEYENY